jgi:3-phosphoshikimate 1-carboxyvinyltransferase
MLAAVRSLGAGVAIDETNGDVRIKGVAGRPRGDVSIDVGGAGTAMRFLAAAAILADAPVTLDGDPRMRQRPLGPLVEALEALGAGARFNAEPGFPPVTITPPDSAEGGDVRLPVLPSGQFVSALLMLAPWTATGLRLRLDAPPTSRPYVDMTLRLLTMLGAAAASISDDARTIEVAPGPLRAFTLDVEPDASSAGPLWTAAAITPGASCLVEGLPDNSLQGDARFPDVLQRMGASVQRTSAGVRVSRAADQPLRAVDVDLADMPDAAMVAAVAACFAEGSTRLRGLRTLRVKESDRLAALQTELTKFGATVRIEPEGDDESLLIEPPPPGGLTEPVAFDTYRDHRMAMALALVALHRPGVEIRDPGCVAKTYPRYWADLARLHESAAEARS